MKWSREQTKAHEDASLKFRQNYVEGKNRVISLEDIKNEKRKCVTLIDRIDSHFNIFDSLVGISNEILERFPEFYFQNILHFTVDRHKYSDKLVENINDFSLNGQQRWLISPKELEAYKQILNEEISKESTFQAELKGVVFGGDGLVAQVWYDDKRMINLTSRLGEKVRKEVPSMDFQWGLSKHKVQLRVVTLTRFTGQENKEDVLKYIDANKNEELGTFNMGPLKLVFSDHYIQEMNTKTLGSYAFKE
ncbi:hypothetical protein CMI39_00765 [Candidatus Pacearchaeota archaeon]|nr:hypothetical protein [Candidatus Pacearchaeota archaeon]